MKRYNDLGNDVEHGAESGTSTHERALSARSPRLKPPGRTLPPLHIGALVLAGTAMVLAFGLVVIVWVSLPADQNLTPAAGSAPPTGVLQSPPSSPSSSMIGSAATAVAGYTPASATMLPSETPTEVPVPTGYTVQIDSGLDVQWTASAAASATMAGLLRSEQLLGRRLAEPHIVSVEATAGKDLLDAFSGPYPEHPIVWVVRARGTFWSWGAPGQPPLVATEGYVVYDDAGNEIGNGSISPSPTH